MNYAVSWSGGKDCALSMWRVWREHGPPAALVTTYEEDGSRSRAHGLAPALLAAQAAALGVPLVDVPTSLPGYAANFGAALARLRDEARVTAAVFGDIELEAHRSWFRKLCGDIGIDCLHPIWAVPREALLREFLDAGFVTRLVAVQDGRLAPALLGRTLDEALIDEFRAAGIDLAGENGEYHSIVVDGPCFARPVALAERARERRDGYWFLDLALD
ncbi:diphthine--ammonia ligase [Tahibacter soli]|uniref:Diphthine--ammonia ligase n=1 Tax=Tahibacter soli TaxID=2983605 RepID=A0A9X3YJX5_9GAMM|nr:diphthine--ammonia ligase [Tahibacter soli]MDC8012962.1 diphthine--ammonia ligase [Tahibacter soli]